MRLPEISKIIQVPDGVEVTVERRKVTVKGSKGTLIRDFSYVPISIEASGDKTVRVWDGRGGAPLRILRGHTGPVSALALSPGGNFLVTGANLPDGAIRVWNVRIMSPRLLIERARRVAG